MDFSEKEFNEIYSAIRAEVLASPELSYGHHAFILGGQPGSGKSVFFQMFDEAQDHYFINGDTFRQYHPHYSDIIDGNPADFPRLTQPFSNRVVERLITDLSDVGANINIEGTLRTASIPLNTCQSLKEKGYSVELMVMACDATLSWENTLTRAEDMAEHGDFPRFVPINVYDENVCNIVQNVETLDKTGMFDKITVINRSGNVLFPSDSYSSPAYALQDSLNVKDWVSNREQRANQLQPIMRSVVHRWETVFAQTSKLALLKDSSVLSRLSSGKLLSKRANGISTRNNPERNIERSNPSLGNNDGNNDNR